MLLVIILLLMLMVLVLPRFQCVLSLFLYACFGETRSLPVDLVALYRSRSTDVACETVHSNREVQARVGEPAKTGPMTAVWETSFQYSGRVVREKVSSIDTPREILFHTGQTLRGARFTPGHYNSLQHPSKTMRRQLRHVARSTRQ